MLPYYFNININCPNRQGYNIMAALFTTPFKIVMTDMSGDVHGRTVYASNIVRVMAHIISEANIYSYSKGITITAHPMVRTDSINKEFNTIIGE